MIEVDALAPNPHELSLPAGVQEPLVATTTPQPEVTKAPANNCQRGYQGIGCTSLTGCQLCTIPC